jgi:hypothetical protein
MAAPLLAFCADKRHAILRLCPEALHGDAG